MQCWYRMIVIFFTVIFYLDILLCTNSHPTCFTLKEPLSSPTSSKNIYLFMINLLPIVMLVMKLACFVLLKIICLCWAIAPLWKKKTNHWEKNWNLSRKVWKVFKRKISISKKTWKKYNLSSFQIVQVK